MLNLNRYLKTVSQGIVMGIAEIIPGVSGSTLALTMGIYDDFINFLHQISKFFKSFIKSVVKGFKFKYAIDSFKEINFKFGVFLILGMGISIALFSNVMSSLLHDYREYIFAIFTGLVLGSVSIPLQGINPDLKRIKIKEILIIVCTFIIFFIVLGLKPLNIGGTPSILFMFVGGFLAISAMVLPGISGSFVMLLIGIYEYVLSLIKSSLSLNLDVVSVSNLFAFGLGVVLGFSIFVHFIKLAFEKFKNLILAFLVGIMLASLRVLWPFIQNVNNEYIYLDLSEYLSVKSLAIVVLILFGFGLVKLIEKFSVKEIKKL